MYRRLAVLLTAALTLAAAPHADAAERREPASITVTTVGNGHGKGLSQYGALNRAKAGHTYQQIVEHYYPHTAWDTAAGNIRIRLTDDLDGNDTVVAARSGLKVRGLSGRSWTLPATIDRKTVKRWRITPSGSDSVVSYRVSSWKAWRTISGDAEFAAGGRPITLHTPEGVAQYRGALRSASTGSGRDTVNVLGIDAYLYGVVPEEVPGSWPAAAVQAQSVAARTYAVFERGNVPASRYYDLCDTSSCQVYNGYDAEYSGSNDAVDATAGKIVTYDGEPAFTQFSASNGGWSIDGGYPYLVAEQDTFDTGVSGQDPYSRTFPGNQVTMHWPGLGDLVSVEVTERDGRGAYGGRVLELLITGTTGSQVATGSQFRSYLGLRSTMFEVTGA